MVVVSYSGKEINAKLVYYGPGLSGKTTNLEFIYKSVPQNSRGKMVSMKTRTERTLFFDFLPVDLGQLGGFKTRFLLYTVPGQVYYNATRKLVLRGVDAVVFVADSERGKMDENKESLQNLRDNLKDYDLDLDELPFVIQYNKRDLEDTYSVEELEKDLNPNGVPYYEATAMTGEGVFECFRGIGQVLLKKLSKEVKLDEKTSAADKLAGAQAASKVTFEPESAAPAQAESSVPDANGTQSSNANKPSAPAEASQGKPDGSGGGAPKPAPSRSPSSERLEKLATSMKSKKTNSADVQAPAAAAEPATFPANSWDEDQPKKPGFLKRLFGRDKSREEDPSYDQPGTGAVVAHIPGKQGGQEPVFLEKRVTVPITLSPEEVVRGATLRLVVEVEVTAAEDDSRQVA